MRGSDVILQGKCKTCEYYCDECRRRQHEAECRGVDNKKPVGDSLCWCCAHATDAGCSWSRANIPVYGWEAKKTRINNGGRGIVSYRVFRCPEFRRG